MNRINRENSTIVIEDFDTQEDTKFIKDALIPYFKDLFRDLSLRTMVTPAAGASSTKGIDKVTFFEYC